MDIYQPDEDSYLLAKWVNELVEENANVLDIGCGSGIQCETALKKTKSVLGVDINPNAIKHCKSSIYCKGAKFRLSNLFEKIPPKKYDVIIFNPPYLPEASDPKEMRDYTTGGKKGYEIIEKFISQSNNYLDDNGFILMIISSLTNKPMVDKILFNYLFEFEILGQKSVMMEILYCYKIKKSLLLKNLNSKKVVQPSYFAKGTRGIIYKARYKNKDVIIKTKNEKSHASNTIINEAKWLKIMNKYNIGPKLYYNDEVIAIIEYIDGDEIMDYIEKSSKAKIKSVVISLFEQMYKLDVLKVEKKEMIRPLKHVIVRSNKPILIDFERTKYVEKPSNVTQFLEFISRIRLIDKKISIELCKSYKKNYDISEIKKYIYSL